MKRICILCLFILSFSSYLHAQSGSYYNSINPNSPTFISELENRIRSPYTKVSYDLFDETNIANFASKDNGNGTRSVFCVYSNYQYIYTPPFTWLPISREHTYCASWQPGNDPPGSGESRPEYTDQHHLFPTQQNNANNIRSNHPLGNVVNVTSTFGEAKFGTNTTGAQVYEPRNQHKGDAARALLYMALRYDGIDGYDWTFNWLNNVKLPSLSEAPQDLATLIAWHKQDPPDKWEVDRNNYIESIQKNRNPLVDHPEYVNYINFNDLSKLSPVYSREPQYYVSSLGTNTGDSSITVNWADALTGTQVPSAYLLIAYNKDNYFLPIDGEIYSDDTDLSDGFAVVNISYSAADTYYFSNLSDDTYYFTIFSYHGSGTSTNYKIDGSFPRISASLNATLAVEPTNFVTNFLPGTITSSSIELTWTNALPGTQVPEGYLVLANTSGTFNAPSDGTVYTDDTNLADGFARINISYASPNSISFAGLNSNTTYYFKIYSYNGIGDSRNYKTDGSVPQTNAITGTSSVSLPNAWINEFHYDNIGNDVNEFVEVVIPITYISPSELVKFSIVLYNGNGGAVYNTKTLNEFTKGSTDTVNGYTYYSFAYPTDGIQNGSPDGMALGYNSNLIQFLSYEGVFTGVGGIADGVLSTDIGVTESNTITQSTSSLGLSGFGKKYSDFYWTTFSGTATRGSANNGQSYLPRILNITAIIEGLYNGSVMVPDTITVELRNISAPYSLLETKKVFLNSLGTGTVSFTKVVDGTPFYIVIKHRNSIETWSTLTKSFSFGSLNYNFTTNADKAFGNNMVQKAAKWCIYSGDVNQDGIIDLSDLSLIDIDNYNFITGYTVTDVNGDGLVDLTDLMISDINASSYIGKVTPN